MIQQRSFFQELTQTPLKDLSGPWAQQTQEILESSNNGHWSHWHKVLNTLPSMELSLVDYMQNTITIRQAKKTNSSQQEQFKQILKSISPWRKGPYNLFEILIDTEWRSDFKWNRLKDHIQPLKDRLIADIGCGNGYHMFRMLGHDPQAVVGLDPTIHYLIQFLLINHYAKDSRVGLLPLRIEKICPIKPLFDTVFSMGVIYHSRNPLLHLDKLKQMLRYGGELVLETLYIEEKHGAILKPKDRYAKMRNVYQIPSCDTIVEWLKQSGFTNIRIIDRNITSLTEQRKTEWIPSNSLAQTLDPEDPSLTVEGYPAPRRIIVLGEK
jgi:tRNA (mo5U34)-methyltransferase